jgi:hypothetical protein
MAIDREKLISTISGLPVTGELGDDNLVIALATYYSDRHDCPDLEPDEHGWNPWAIERTEELIGRIAAAAIAAAEADKAAEIERLKAENEILRQRKPIELRAEAKAYAKRMQSQVDALYEGLEQIHDLAIRVMREDSPARLDIVTIFYRTMARIAKKEIQG